MKDVTNIQKVFSYLCSSVEELSVMKSERETIILLWEGEGLRRYIMIGEGLRVGQNGGCLDT